ncbi:DUF2993 domain-containing protein [Corynebacterium pelargi]|uniref:LmeA family phospholipid-binding protein n=1 Tax=Corynebacterium pelargi TaxID=1471400 RepID=UPI0013E89CB5|nr:DUF2993 domain-containing protein [Corynebacterium pelargi]
MSKSSSGIFKVVLSILAVLLIVLIGSEFGARWYVTKQIRDEVGQSADGRQAEVSLGSSPLLLGMLQKDVDQVEITTPDTVKIERPADPNAVPVISGTPDAHIMIEHLDISDPDHLIAQDLQLTTQLSNEFLLANLQVYLDGALPQEPAPDANLLESLAGKLIQNTVSISDVQSHPQNGTMEVEISNGAANIELEPRVKDGQLTFVAKNTSVLGFSLPSSVSDALTQAFKQAAGSIDVGLEFKGIKVLDDGMEVELEGHDIDLNELSAENNFGPSV